MNVRESKSHTAHHRTWRTLPINQWVVREWILNMISAFMLTQVIKKTSFWWQTHIRWAAWNECTAHCTLHIYVPCAYIVTIGPTNAMHEHKNIPFEKVNVVKNNKTIVRCSVFGMLRCFQMRWESDGKLSTRWKDHDKRMFYWIAQKLYNKMIKLG